jgi:hypothetical protein
MCIVKEFLKLFSTSIFGFCCEIWSRYIWRQYCSMFVTRKTQGRRWPYFSLGVNKKIVSTRFTAKPYDISKESIAFVKCVFAASQSPTCAILLYVSRQKIFMSLRTLCTVRFQWYQVLSEARSFATSPLVVIIFLCSGRYTPDKDTLLLFRERAVGCLWELDVRGSVQHSIIHTKITNKIQQCI